MSTDDLHAEAKRALAKARDDIREATTRRNALLATYLSNGVPMTVCAAALGRNDRGTLYRYARSAGYVGPEGTEPVMINGREVPTPAARVYDHLVDNAVTEDNGRRVARLRMSDVAAAAGYTTGHTSRLVGTLVELGLVTRRQQISNRRQFSVSEFEILDPVDSPAA